MCDILFGVGDGLSPLHPVPPSRLLKRESRGAKPRRLSWAKPKGRGLKGSDFIPIPNRDLSREVSPFKKQSPQGVP